jgi:ABC-2 type transport system permease protein
MSFSFSILSRGVLVTTEKNIRIYYKKAPVVIFGILFPLFMFISFYIGRNINISRFFPGFLAMTLFFTASSVGPLITPWEKQAGTYERLLSYPVKVITVILGDVVAGMVFGSLVTTLVLTAGLLMLDIPILSIFNIVILAVGAILGCLCFASLGVLLASPSSKAPSNVMMLSSLVRFPLIFISGIFVPLDELGGIGLFLSYFSPLTYLVDIFNACLNGLGMFPLVLDIIALTFFTFMFLVAANLLHKRSLAKGL